MGSIPGLGRSPGGGHGNPFQYSYLENPMNGGAWRATVHRVAESQIRLKRLSMTHIVSLVRWFLLFNEVNQLYVYIYPLPLGSPFSPLAFVTPLPPTSHSFLPVHILGEYNIEITTATICLKNVS